jgi:hypothetical protein
MHHQKNVFFTDRLLEKKLGIRYSKYNPFAAYNRFIDDYAGVKDERISSQINILRARLGVIFSGYKILWEIAKKTFLNAFQRVRRRAAANQKSAHDDEDIADAGSASGDAGRGGLDAPENASEFAANDEDFGDSADAEEITDFQSFCRKHEITERKIASLARIRRKQKIGFFWVSAILFLILLVYLFLGSYLSAAAVGFWVVSCFFYGIRYAVDEYRYKNKVLISIREWWRLN